MIRERTRVDYLLAFAAITFVIAARASGDEKPEGPTGPSQWAIIADKSHGSSAFADLLMVKLSEAPNVRLVERERIDGVLQEQQLTALGSIEHSRMISLGQLISADALVLVDRNPHLPWVRVRLVESATGIHLWDELSDVSGEASAVETLAKDLLAAGDKLRSTTKRQTVSVMGIVSEERSSELLIAARSLQAFLERDLQANSGVVVLERERLRHLLDERDLTDIELALKNAAVLIEGSVRQSGERKLLLGVKVSRPDGQAFTTIELEGDSQDLQQLRVNLLSRTLQALEATSSLPSGGEASQFARRAAWLAAQHRHEEAVNAGYAALALAPSRENYRRVRDSQTYLAGNWYRMPWQPSFTALALDDARLAHELDLRQLEIGARNGGELIEKQLLDAWRDPFSPHVRIERTESTEFQSQRAAYDQVRLAKYELLHNVLENDAEALLCVLIPRLHLSAYFATTHEDHVAKVLSLQAEIDRSMTQLEATSKWRAVFEKANGIALWWAMWLQTFHAMDVQVSGNITDNPNVPYGQRREWKPEVIRPICEALRDHPSAQIRLVVADHEVAVGGKDGLAAAKRVFTQLRDEHTKVSSLAVTINRRCARTLQEAGELAALVEPLIVAAERTKDVSQLMEWPGGISTIVLDAELTQRRQWVERIVRLFESAITAESSPDERRATKFQVDRLQQNLPPLPPGSPGASATETDELWKNFSVSIFQAEAPAVDQCILANEATGLPRLQLRAARSADALAEVKTLAIPLAEPWRDRLHVEASPKELFAIQRDPLQIVAITPQRTRRVAVLPEGTNRELHGVFARWLDGKLYLARSNAFETIDVTTGQVTSLASGLAAVARNGLDGDAFGVGGMVADESHTCIWLSIASRERGGIWKYTPSDGSLEHVVRGGSNLCQRDGDRLLLHAYRPDGLWHSLDTESEVLTTFSGYRWAGSSNGMLRPPCIKVGEYAVGSNGVMLTQDGRSAQFPLTGDWDVLYPHNGGFIAASCKPTHCTVWQFESRIGLDDKESPIR